MRATSDDERPPRGLALDRVLARAADARRVPPELAGLLRALLVRRRRSGSEMFGPDERALSRLMVGIFAGEPSACSNAAAILRRMMGP